jgi:hypothetical protein
MVFIHTPKREGGQVSVGAALILLFLAQLHAIQIRVPQTCNIACLASWSSCPSTGSLSQVSSELVALLPALPCCHHVLLNHVQQQSPAFLVKVLHCSRHLLLHHCCDLQLHYCHDLFCITALTYRSPPTIYCNPANHLLCAITVH